MYQLQLSVVTQSKINKRIQKLTIVSEHTWSNNHTFHTEARTLGKLVLLVLDPPEFSLRTWHIRKKCASVCFENSRYKTQKVHVLTGKNPNRNSCK